ncbi:GNAT family N-acetyltransferase [bacterium]|nr:MAG: GNAT family N-acetyltransferase [bacterium]
MTLGPEQDSERLVAWQADALEAHRADTELLSIGPFRALLSTAGEPSGWVTLVDGEITQAETAKGVSKLRATFKKRGAALEIEYNEAAFPQVGPWLEAAGLKVEERNPLMSCRPARFKPFAAPDVVLTRLTPTSKPAELQAFQTMRWTSGGDSDRPAPPVERLQQELAVSSSVFLLAWLDWEPAGTGVSHALKGAAEVVGVATRADVRRRGVAATVTSELVSRHFAAGGDFVFLDAANEGAARVYERLGFTRFGAKLAYR